jgi:CubicO group peptidase (beta-lactamase class C family)
VSAAEPPGRVPGRDPRVSGANWLEAPFNRWTMWNVRELVPTQRVARGAGPALPLADGTHDADLFAVRVPRVDGSTSTVQAVLDDTDTDAFAVLQEGTLVAEWYAPGGAPDRVHALLSITKSIVGCVAGVLLHRGILQETRLVRDLVPELSTSGYADATVRDLLDMRSGVQFLEEYTNPAAEVRLMDEWILGDRGLYAFLATLSSDRPHGGAFRYRSSETDVLGWVCERASGTPMSALIGELVWAPMGAEHDAVMMCDRLGTAVHESGLSATAKDLLRFGHLLLGGGAVRTPDGEERQVLPARWLRHAWAVDADIRTAFMESPAELSFPGGWYRNQFWFRVGPHGDLLLCLGIHGQLLYVSRRTGTVIVKLSSWPMPQNPAFLQDTLRACDAISGALTNRPSTGDVHRLPGVVSGSSRSGRAHRRGPSAPPGPQVVDAPPPPP